MKDHDEQRALVTAMAAAWLSNPHTHARAEDVPTLLGALNSVIVALGTPPARPEPGAAAPVHTGATSIRRSLASPDHIISMIDGKPYRSLTRHLSAKGLTPEQYRERYGLKPDYPMVAPGYSAERSASAKQRGLGRKDAEKSAVPSPAKAATPGKRPRKSVAQAKRDAQAHLGTSDVHVDRTVPGA